MKSLYVFTAQFPYGFRESFLEAEAKFLSEKFDKVVFIPLGGEGTKQRELPKNCYVDTSLHARRCKKIIRSFLGMPYVFPMYIKLLLEDKVYGDLAKFRRWLFSLIMCSYYRQSRIVRRMLKEVQQQDVIYSYWGADYNSILPFFVGRAKIVSRFHGHWDLWQSMDDEGYIPNRSKLMQSLNAAVTISHKGECFLRKLYPCAKLKTFHLGSLDKGVGIKSADHKLHVLSCSAVYPLKRVSLIFEALNKINDIDVEWTHIGDGPTFEDLKKRVASEKALLKVFLKGRLKHSEVLQYYKENPVDLFINLSTNEGIPVAIMEAISFNVPVIATNVGSTSEIVTSETGILLNPNPSIDEISKAVHDILKRSFEPRSFWNREFNAENNYSEFADFIYNL